MADFVVPIAVVILIALFAVQPRGTAKIGRIFGPIMVIWFLTLAGLGIPHILENPSVLAGLNPVHAVQFFLNQPLNGFLALGSVFLVVTGGEALYADMGHFGPRPIRISWFVVVFPALLLNYFGQGALLIADPDAIENPFYKLAPEWGLYPLVVLATMATVIASQALISGAFSLTMQATQLGYSPRVRIRHTSETEAGQIYVPAINWALMLACIGLVLGFRSSTNLAAAYGVAVTATMVITTVLFYVVARERMAWPRTKAIAVCGVFLVIDLGFLGANLFKIPYGGWFPLVVGAIVFTMLTTWRKGRELVAERLRRNKIALTDFAANIRATPPTRVTGDAVYLYSSPDQTPPSLAANLRHNHALHERVIVLSIVTEKIPRVEDEDRVDIIELGDGLFRLVGHYGFLEDPNIPDLFDSAASRGFVIDLTHVTYFLGREALRVTQAPGMARWREHLFAFMSRNATPAANYFSLPMDQTIEVGVQVEL
jgi:KUP system potassium uptake protein